MPNSKPYTGNTHKGNSCSKNQPSIENTLAHIVNLFQCAACMELLFQPLTLPCGYSVCRRCFRRPSAKPIRGRSLQSQVKLMSQVFDNRTGIPSNQLNGINQHSSTLSFFTAPEILDSQTRSVPVHPQSPVMDTISTNFVSDATTTMRPYTVTSDIFTYTNTHDTSAALSMASATATESPASQTTLNSAAPPNIPSRKFTFPAPSPIWDADHEATARQAVDCVGAYICPVRACRRQHRFRGERGDVILTSLLERLFPKETAALRLVLQGEERLKQYWNPAQPMCQDGYCDIGSKDPTSCTVRNKEHDLLDIIQSCFEPAIAQCEFLQLPYVVRAKVYAELGRFDEATASANFASYLNPINRRGLITEKLIAWRKRMHESQLHILATCAMSALYCTEFNNGAEFVAKSVQTAVEDLRTEIYTCIYNEDAADGRNSLPHSWANMNLDSTCGSVPSASSPSPSSEISSPTQQNMFIPSSDGIPPCVQKVSTVSASDVCVDPNHSSESFMPFALQQTLQLLCANIVAAYPELLTLQKDQQSIDALVYTRLGESLLTLADLECHLCLSPMVQPITCPCGHSWCKNCLLKSLDHSRDCPMCRFKLPPIGYFMMRPNNRIMDRLIRTISNAHRPVQAVTSKTVPSFPVSDAYAHSTPLSVATLGLNGAPTTISSASTHSNSAFTELEAEPCGTLIETLNRGDTPFKAIEKIPLFICSLVFPGSSQGYHVVEPRYRVLIKRCLESNRRFGIVMPRPSHADESPCMDHGTLVYIKRFDPLFNCDIVSTCDGNLPHYVLEVTALHRFHIISIEKNTAGYYEGYVERVEDIEPEDECNRDRTGDASTGLLPVDNGAGNTSTNLDIQARSEFHSPHHYHQQQQGGKFQQHYNYPTSSVSAPKPQQPSSTPQWRYNQDWDPSALVTLIYKARHFVLKLLASLPMAARHHFERQHGKMPDDPAELSFWLAEFLPLNPYVLYALLPLKSVTGRMRLICSWIDQTLIDQQQQSQIRQ
ncbi:hypothetical protein BATDEDRAFT_87470 [Batrachochytrium dendrobatidis JAM81]|uniref:RING-type domain-containing protein n=1 Tax=Batrachochytrium dendrobatidis (strain JAM81 / FGSC 10211) TaxID=684364 RepID=F4NZM9_BATDJ|nr:uncharacterized protein BATDEDRAFT_87470 [Batrachochytrium dendrobatidis JAM81]EGF81520.1 hypothetical protein BATDEDRAFT_87470 [Batrachochytrium dendrobatidis JAM81]|eukprot:XP_006678230.1 hypothetical protein BATDEDRAFT_87470 [Batrachochytrium dendrobatidis JAM81]